MLSYGRYLRSQGAQGFSPRDFPMPDEFGGGGKRPRLDSDSQSDDLRDSEWCRRQVSPERTVLPEVTVVH